MAALLPARRAAAAAAAASASASASASSASAAASASAARRLSSSSSSRRSLSSVSTAPAAAAAAAAATRAIRAPPPVGNMPEPFAWKEEPAPPTPAGWKATTSAPKKTTRLAGLHPEPHAREKLHALYEQTLRAVRRLEGGSDGGERRDNHPNPYRAAVEQLTRHRMALVAAEPDIPALEEKIGAGQIEELLQQARDELELIPVMASWRPWERPSAEAGAGGASGGPYPAHEPAVLVEDRAKAFLKDMVDTSPREQK